MSPFAEFFQPWTPHYVSQVLPWRAVAADGVVLLKHQHGLLRTYQLHGHDTDGVDPEEQGAKALAINNVLRRLGGKWASHFEAYRTNAPVPSATGWPHPTMARVDARHRASLVGRKRTTYYVSVAWTPPALRHQKRWWLTEAETQASVRDRALDEFCMHTNHIADHLRSLLAQCRPLNTPEQLTYLHACVSERRSQTLGWPACPTDLDIQLADTPWVGGWEPRLGSQHLRFLTILGYPAQSLVGMMRRLDALDLEYRWSTRWLGMEQHAQAGLLKRVQQAWIHQEKGLFARMAETLSHQETRTIDSDATNKALEADAARQELGADLVAYGMFSASVAVWDTDADQAEAKRQQVRQVLESAGFTVSLETHHSTAVWLSMMPGNVLDSIRRTPQHSLTLAHMAPGMRAAWTGGDTDTSLHGGPWFYATTETSTLFGVANRVNGVGHVLVLGPSGSGKTTLAAFGTSQWFRYDHARVWWLDVDGGAKQPTQAMGGQWHDLAGGQLALQPLRHCDKTVARSWALQWLLNLCDDAHVPLTGEVRQYLSAGLQSLAQRPVSQRTLSALLEILAAHSLHVDRTATAGKVDAQGISRPDLRLHDLVRQHHMVRTALLPWTQRGDYGWLFDGSHDDLGTARLQTFEMRGLLDRPRLIRPIMGYLFWRMQQSWRPEHPTLVVMDEAAILWNHATFEDQAREWMMTARKFNVSLMFLTHSISQVFASSLGPMLAEACKTRIYLPNPAAWTLADIYAKLQLTKADIAQIATATPQRDLYYQTPHGKRLLHLPLDTGVWTTRRSSGAIRLVKTNAGGG